MIDNKVPIDRLILLIQDNPYVMWPLLVVLTIGICWWAYSAVRTNHK